MGNGKKFYLIEERLQDHLLQIEQLFPFGMAVSIIGISEDGWNFVLGDTDPEKLIACIKKLVDKEEKKAAKLIACLNKSMKGKKTPKRKPKKSR
jgi:hypothetical protein